MRFTSLIVLIFVSILPAFGEALPPPTDPTAPATAVQVPGHWETQADNTAIWKPATWQVTQGAVTTTTTGKVVDAPTTIALRPEPVVRERVIERVVYVPAPAPVQERVVYEPAPVIYQEPQQVVYVQQPQQVVYQQPACSGLRQVAIYGDCDRVFGNQYYGGGIICGSSPLPRIDYEWQVYGHQELRSRGCHR